MMIEWTGVPLSTRFGGMRSVVDIWLQRDFQRELLLVSGAGNKVIANVSCSGKIRAHNRS